MEFRDLKKQYQIHKEELDSAIQEVLTHADFISGSKVKQLEIELAKYVDVKHCITCANGTDALQLALMTWNVGKNDAVFVPDLTFFSSGEVASLVGATPVFVDVEKDTYNISPESLEQVIQYILQKTDLKPRVVVAVDLFGQPADFRRIKLIADKYDLFILEDAAQGFGGKIGEQRACSFGDIATTSFFPAKPLGCYGDGGAVFTNNDEWAELLRSYRVHGKGEDKYDNVRIGMNSRLDTIQAAILLEKLKFLDKELECCDKIARQYTRQLKDIVKVPIVKEEMRSAWAQYTIQLKDRAQRENVMAKLKESGIPSAIYYKKPMHMQQAFESVFIKDIMYSVTDRICDTCLSLPMHAYLHTEEVENICNILKSVVDDTCE